MNVVQENKSAWFSRTERVLTKKQVSDIKRGKSIAILVSGKWLVLKQKSKESLRLAEIDAQIKKLRDEKRRLV